MSIRLSYQTDDGETLYSELGLSESYEEILNAACVVWKDDMPPDEYIVGRYLVRDEVSDSGTIAVQISPCRFIELVRNVALGQRLDLRLKLKVMKSIPAIFELPPVMSRGDKDPSLEELEDPNSTINSGETSPALLPLTPGRVFRPESQHNGSNRSTITVGSSRSMAYHNGRSAYSAGQYHDALLHFQDAIADFRERGNSTQEAECLSHIGVIYRHEKEYSKARSHFSDARAIYERLGGGYREKQLHCDRQLAQVDERAGDLLKALHAYQGIRTTAREEGFPKQEAWCAYSLGRLCNKVDRHGEALDQLKQAVEIAQSLQCRDTKLEIEAFAAEESGLAEELRKNKSRAIEHYEWALRRFAARGRGGWIADENRVNAKLRELRHGHWITSIFN